MTVEAAATEQNEEVQRNYRPLPWDAPNSEGIPWHLHRWFVHADSGTICLLSAKIKYNTVSRQWEREDQYEERFKDIPVILEKPDLERVFQLSATKGITLIQAVIEDFGEDNLSNSWMTRALAGKEQYADPRYAEKPTTTKSGRGRRSNS